MNFARKIVRATKIISKTIKKRAKTKKIENYNKTKFGNEDKNKTNTLNSTLKSPNESLNTETGGVKLEPYPFAVSRFESNNHSSDESAKSETSFKKLNTINYN